MIKKWQEFYNKSYLPKMQSATLAVCVSVLSEAVVYVVLSTSNVFLQYFVNLTDI